ncbi:uncharacterized protein K452DRAFT_313805 [Aplosporella prunicola CBS 121167]|uniref:Uncharacterized protein n=1 Tax=Aplosporella prunicola CBS 121167 TaxID=1176127 RepID=A0A6A6AVP2_9PEZI|nr:uncharacterized protein K452DRAFT_313805 [Aplosporella prunicola CBS 121167]KAF2135666.1 hypothetical protein K452DRAFT_313805 [Aplosporella prunicola CBS 121167]
MTTVERESWLEEPSVSEEAITRQSGAGNPCNDHNEPGNHSEGSIADSSHNSGDEFEGDLCRHCQVLIVDDRDFLFPAETMDGHTTTIFPTRDSTQLSEQLDSEASNVSEKAPSEKPYHLDTSILRQHQLLGSPEFEPMEENSVTGDINLYPFEDSATDTTASSAPTEQSNRASNSSSNSENLKLQSYLLSRRSGSEEIRNLSLPYKRIDEWPGLPCLSRSSHNGCKFCKILLLAILKEIQGPEGGEGEHHDCKRIKIDNLKYRWSSKWGLSLIKVNVAFMQEQSDVNINKQLLFTVECEAGNLT